MSDLREEVTELADKKRHILRRRKLLELLKKIQRGELDASKVPLDKLYELYVGGGPRREYESPADRSTYNYGYMWMGEMMAGTPNVK